MRLSRARSNGPAASCHMLSSVDCITTTSESEFLVHTPFEVGNQVLISSHRKLLLSKAMVVSVAETPGQDSGRQG